MTTQKKPKFDYSPYLLTLEPAFNILLSIEYQFVLDRNWKLDAAVACCKLAIEIEGGSFGGKGHRGITNFNNDMEKYNRLSVEGWHLLRFTPKQVKSLMIVDGDTTFFDTLTKYFYNHPCSHQDLNEARRALRAS